MIACEVEGLLVFLLAAPTVAAKLVGIALANGGCAQLKIAGS